MSPPASRRRSWRRFLSLELLRRGVQGCSEVGAGTRRLRRLVQSTGDTEVGYLGVPVLVEQDVVGLDVAVNHTSLVGVGQTGRELFTEPGELRTRAADPAIL